MSNLDHADADKSHLLPKFAQALQKILAQATVETTGKHGV